MRFEEKIILKNDFERKFLKNKKNMKEKNDVIERRREF